MNEEILDIQTFEIHHKKADCVLSVGRIGQRWSIAADLTYRTGNFHSSSGGFSVAQTFDTKEAALDEVFRRALKHFAPSSLHRNDSCVNEEQRRLAVQMTAEIEALRSGTSVDGQYALFAEVLA